MKKKELDDIRKRLKVANDFMAIPDAPDEEPNMALIHYTYDVTLLLAEIDRLTDTPPDRLDAIRERAEALGVNDWRLDRINTLLLELDSYLNAIENQRLDRKEVTE